jgi:hypothetical protein
VLKLISTSGAQSIDLQPGRTLVVGRAVTSDIPIYDPTISRRHAELSLTETGVLVRDLGSSNGTFVATTGDPLPDVPLTQGVRREIEESDRVFIGAWTRLVIRKALPGEA